jgi:hypothetical protein
MRVSIGVAAGLCVWVLGSGLPARAAVVSPVQGRETHLELSCGEGPAQPPCSLGSSERRQVFEDVFEYSYRVRVGPGVYDFITLHRVVRETAPGVPLRTPKSVFLVHGDIWGFRGAFLGSLGSEAVARQQSFALFLARRGVDVWAICGG